jgi:preprotein translocase subunit SecA
MAGHGTDIILGGNAEFMARLKPCEMLLPQFVHCTGSMGSFGRHGAVCTKSVLARLQSCIIEQAVVYMAKVVWLGRGDCCIGRGVC